MAKRKAVSSKHGTKPAPNTTNLPQKAALVLFVSGQFTNTKKDNKASERVIKDAKAQTGAAKVQKYLLPGNEYVKRIAKNISEFRQDYLYVVTLPWGDDGWRLIPAQRISEFKKKYREHKDIHDDLVSKFLAEYPKYVADAKQQLGELFNEADYKTTDEVKACYRFETDWNSIADANDLRVQISEEASEEIRKEITDSTSKKLHAAVADTYRRVHETVAHVAERLAVDEEGDGKVFRNTLISNVRELAEVLPSLNVTDDPALAKVAEDLHNKLGKLDPDELRENPNKAKKAQKTAQDILAELDGAF